MTGYAICRTCKDDWYALKIMQAMLNKGIDIVSITCDPEATFTKYHVWGVKDSIGRNDTIDSFNEELDKAIQKIKIKEKPKRKRGDVNEGNIVQ